MAKTSAETFLKVLDGDVATMQKFADAATSGESQFWDRDYPYGAHTIGTIILEDVRDASSRYGEGARGPCSKSWRSYSL